LNRKQQVSDEDFTRRLILRETSFILVWYGQRDNNPGDLCPVDN
jgi:hypothetical protein